jgi:CRISP-associated protein Cas1
MTHPMTPYTVEALEQVWDGLLAKWSRSRRDPPVGVDGTRVEVFEKNRRDNLREIARLVHRTDSHAAPAYRFAPLLRMERPKRTGGSRIIHIPRLRDQIVLRAMHEDVVATAARRGIPLRARPPKALLDTFRATLRPHAVVVRTDVRDFFPSVPRERVVDLVGSLRPHPLTGGLLARWSTTLRARAPWTSGSDRDAPVLGVPPGVSLSSCLAELWMAGLDAEMVGRTSYHRYVDDIAIVCDSAQEASREQTWLESRIRSLGLEISPAKTSTHRLDDGVPWLGLVHFVDRTVIEAGRTSQWLRRFAAIRQRAGAAVAQPGADSDQILSGFHQAIRDEITGRTSSRPAWYALTVDDGSWRRLDQSLHAIIRSLHRQAGVPPQSGR